MFLIIPFLLLLTGNNSNYYENKLFSDCMFGDPREMVLHYFLADDTIEIREVIPPNSGRDAAPMFLRRGKLPKNIESPVYHGQGTVSEYHVSHMVAGLACSHPSEKK
jgi:hypothetical protein